MTSVINIDNLDELISEVYNAVYGKPQDYGVEFFNISNLKMDRFKLQDYNLDTIFNKTKIRYLGESSTGLRENYNDPDTEIVQHVFKRDGYLPFKNNDNESETSQHDMHATMIKIIPYRNEDSVNNIKDPVNVNQIIKTLLSELVVNKRTSNSILPIINIDVRGSDLRDYPDISQYIDKDKYYSIEITEKFYKTKRLDSFLKNYPLDDSILKSIIYQAIDVLFQISLIYSKFRYNQFVPSKMDCYLKNNDDVIIPDIKLCNFCLSEIKTVVDNDYITQIAIDDSAAQYADLYQFLSYLWINHNIDINKYPELIQIFDVLLPEKIRSENDYLTSEMWDKLLDNEKNALKIKNIRNNKFFANKDSLANSNYMNRINFNDLITEAENNFDTTENSFTESDLLNKTTYTINDFNKKSNNNDIDIMSNKSKSKKYTKNNSENHDTETTEKNDSIHDIVHQSRQSRIFSVNGNDYSKSKSKNSKIKFYKGRRTIATPDFQYLKDPKLSELANLLNTQNTLPQTQNNNQFAQYNAQQQDVNQSRINSMGSFLGATPNDVNKIPANYNQLMQNYSQNQIQEPTYLPGQYPQEMMMQNSQNTNDALMRYLQAANQIPGQTQTTDLSAFNSMAMQNQQAMPQMMPQMQYPQMPQAQMPQAQMPQAQFPMQGGGRAVNQNQSPFFFQQNRLN